MVYYFSFPKLANPIVSLFRKKKAITASNTLSGKKRTIISICFHQIWYQHSFHLTTTHNITTHGMVSSLSIDEMQTHSHNVEMFWVSHQCYCNNVEPKQANPSSCLTRTGTPIRQLQHQPRPQRQFAPPRTLVYPWICTRQQSEVAWIPAPRASCVTLHSPWRRLLHPAEDYWQNVRWTNTNCVNYHVKAPQAQYLISKVSKSMLSLTIEV